MPQQIQSIEQIEAKARADAAIYDNVNDACPYSFYTEAGRVYKITNRPWPVLDTQGAEIINVASLNLNAEWRQTNTWQTWAYVFTRQADELQDRMTLQRHQAAEASLRARFAA